MKPKRVEWAVTAGGRRYTFQFPDEARLFCRSLAEAGEAYTLWQRGGAVPPVLIEYFSGEVE